MVNMKIYIFLIALTCIAFACGVFVPPRPGHKKHLLGSEHCTWGPGYWCQNLTAAAGCHAVKHCIQTDWIHRQLPPDDSDVCKICLDMVKEARDNLESNDTQELIKQVFEGSCALIHIKPIVKECDKIADNYIPELVDTLASQMNPQVVCSVAGLCNNEKLYAETEELSGTEVAPVKLNKCQGCHKVVDMVEDKFNKMSRDDFLQNLLQYCGKFGSFSDGCSNLVITYFTDIYNHLQEHLNSEEVCLMSGECSAQFHSHRARVEITPNSHIGYVSVGGVNEDLPCQLCEQLVDHLRNLLVANTTEDEFKQVLDGICKQMKQFSDECSALVDTYYTEVYSFLLNKLNSTEICDDIGICQLTENKGVLIAPLLSTESAQRAEKISSESKLVHIKIGNDAMNVRPLYDVDLKPLSEVNIEQPLPIELLSPPHTQALYNTEVCEFCEYFLHFVQVEVSEPRTSEKIKQLMDKACEKLPTSINETCVDFVNTYEPALVAILVQEIDPSVVCPMIKACPAADADVEIFMKAKSDSKCPLCLVAMTKLEDLIASNKSEAEIRDALKKVCQKFPKSIADECQVFVDEYTDRIIEMLHADLTPTEVCCALHLCNDTKPARPALPNMVYKQVGANIETNAIPDNTVNGQVIIDVDAYGGVNPQCVLCEFIMKEIQDQLKNKNTDKEIENIVKDVCKIMPSSIKQECDDFIDQYAETIIQLLITTLKPSDICTYIGLCQKISFKEEILNCPVCEMTVDIMEKVLSNPKVDHDIEHVVEKTCRGLPQKYKDRCVKMVETYGDAMINMLIHGAGKDICKKFGYCNSLYTQVVID